MKTVQRIILTFLLRKLKPLFVVLTLIFSGSQAMSSELYTGDGFELWFDGSRPQKQIVTLYGQLFASSSELKKASQVFSKIDPRKELILRFIDYYGGNISSAENLVKSIKHTCEKNRDVNDPSQSCDITTFVPEWKRCVSACIIPFMAGKKRVACKDAEFGFHSVGFGFAGISFKATKSYTVSSLTSLGVFKSWVNRNIEIFSTLDVTYLNPEQLAGSNIVTDIDPNCSYVD